MASALDMLRHYNMKKKLGKIKESGNHFMFGKLKWRKKIKTNLMASGSKQDGAPQKFYTLESLVFFLQYVDEWEKSYIRNANYKNISVINEEDRQAILAYFNGQSAKLIPDLKLKKVPCKEAINGNAENADSLQCNPETNQNEEQPPLQAENIQYVKSSDRVNVIKYLNGELDSIPNLNENVMYAFPFGVKRPAIELPDEETVGTKRPKFTNDLTKQEFGESRNETNLKPHFEGPLLTSGQNPVFKSTEYNKCIESIASKRPEVNCQQPATDPLTMLRQYIIEEKQITINDGTIVFGDLFWPKNVKTNYQIWGSGRNGKEKEYYTLECLLCFLRNVSQRHPAYVNQAQIEKVPFVRRPDRKELLAYLKGVISTSGSLDKSVHSEPPNSINEVADFQNETKRKVEEGTSAEADLTEVNRSTESEPVSLSEALSLERIAAIKAKRLANKLKTE